MTQEHIEEIMDNEDIEYSKEDNQELKWLNILYKYSNKKDTIIYPEHDQIYSIEISEAIENWITMEDVKKLKSLNWFIENWGFSCFT